MSGPAVPADQREQHWQERLALPVVVAALVSVPAVFLTLLDEPYATAGTVANALSGAVLLGETAVLFVVSRDKHRWLRDNWLLVLLSLLVLLAVVLAVGPLQLLRLVRALGALRLLRASRIVSAARALGRRHGGSSRLRRLVTVVPGLVVAVFVVIVLSDPTSRSRLLLQDLLGESATSTVVVVLAGLVLGVATFVVVRNELSGDGGADGGADAPPAEVPARDDDRSRRR
ncbi:hypothetical protein [Jannaschia sp. R86511]|uniref:hypothetical protein n=1 Tax=Jannaschia sp. R86511 TaxID=3093853 RepID=UPI0036D3D331